MQQQWQQLADKFIQLSMRERVMLLTVVAFGLIYLPYSFVIEPASTKVQRLQSQLESKQQEKNQLTLDNLALLKVIKSDPNLPNKIQLSQTKTALNSVENELALFTSDLIDSAEMAFVLGDVLAKAEQVKLLAVETLPVVALKPVISTADEQNVSSESQQVNVYRHSLRMTLSGEYFAIQAYLDSIENLPKQLYWQMFDYSLQEYPQAKVVMEFYTLSLNKEFIRG